jgi:hypothetical protein
MEIAADVVRKVNLTTLGAFLLLSRNQIFAVGGPAGNDAGGDPMGLPDPLIDWEGSQIRPAIHFWWLKINFGITICSRPAL